MIVKTHEEFKQHIDRIRAFGRFSMDYETTGFDSEFYKRDGEILVIGAAFFYIHNGERVKFWAPINHHRVERCIFDPEYTAKTGEPFRRISSRIPDQLDEAFFTECIVSLLEDPNVTFVNHNVKFELKITKNLCALHLNRELIDVCTIMDSQASSNLLNKSPQDLKTRTTTDLGREPLRFNDVVSQGKAWLAHLVPMEDLALYATADVENSWDLILNHISVMNTKTNGKPSLEHGRKFYLLKDLEGPTVSYLADMEHAGVLIDLDKMQGVADALEQEFTETQKRFFEIAGVDESFNINSVQQLIPVLFDSGMVDELPPFKTGKADSIPRPPSTSKDYLREIIATEHGTSDGIELCKLLLSYRELSDLHGKFALNLIERASNSVDGRVHGIFKQFKTVTTRLASAEPNLQNIPVRSKNGKKIRDAFIARPGYTWVSGDYSQVEVRLLAHVSNCERLRKIYRDNLDIYKDVASLHYSVDYDDVTAEQRQTMKSVVLGRNYGLGATKYAMQHMIPVPLARQYFASYDARFPELVEFANEQEAFAKKHGYVGTLLGHTRSFREALAKQHYIKNEVTNMPVQGLAAGVLKIAQKLIRQEFIKRGWWMSKVYPLIQVHDELNFEVADCILEEAKLVIKTCMESVGEMLNLSVPLLTSSGEGHTWLEAH